MEGKLKGRYQQRRDGRVTEKGIMGGFNGRGMEGKTSAEGNWDGKGDSHNKIGKI